MMQNDDLANSSRAQPSNTWSASAIAVCSMFSEHVLLKAACCLCIGSSKSCTCSAAA